MIYQRQAADPCSWPECRYVHTRVGVGGRMDTIQCAVVLAKLERFHWEVEQRQILGDRYNGALAGVIPFVVQRSDRTSVFAQYTVFAEGRDELQQLLKSEGIPTAVHYPLPLNEQQAYRQFCCTDCLDFSTTSAVGTSLPMSPDMTSLIGSNNRVVGPFGLVACWRITIGNVRGSHESSGKEICGSRRCWPIGSHTVDQLEKTSGNHNL